MIREKSSPIITFEQKMIIREKIPAFSQSVSHIYKRDYKCEGFGIYKSTIKTCLIFKCINLTTMGKYVENTSKRKKI